MFSSAVKRPSPPPPDNNVEADDFPSLEQLSRWSRAYQTVLPELSRRQRLILRAVLRGKTNRKIATLLDVSMRTVESERSELQRRLGVDNPMTLVYRMGVFDAVRAVQSTGTTDWLNEFESSGIMADQSVAVDEDQ